MQHHLRTWLSLYRDSGATYNYYSVWGGLWTQAPVTQTHSNRLPSLHYHIITFLSCLTICMVLIVIHCKALIQIALYKFNASITVTVFLIENNAPLKLSYIWKSEL